MCLYFQNVIFIIEFSWKRTEKKTAGFKKQLNKS